MCTSPTWKHKMRELDIWRRGGQGLILTGYVDDLPLQLENLCTWAPCSLYNHFYIFRNRLQCLYLKNINNIFAAQLHCPSANYSQRLGLELEYSHIQFFSEGTKVGMSAANFTTKGHMFFFPGFAMYTIQKVCCSMKQWLDIFNLFIKFVWRRNFHMLCFSGRGGSKMFEGSGNCGIDLPAYHDNRRTAFFFWKNVFSLEFFRVFMRFYCLILLSYV